MKLYIRLRTSYEPCNHRQPAPSVGGDSGFRVQGLGSGAWGLGLMTATRINGGTGIRYQNAGGGKLATPGLKAVEFGVEGFKALCSPGVDALETARDFSINSI